MPQQALVKDEWYTHVKDPIWKGRSFGFGQSDFWRGLLNAAQGGGTRKMEKSIEVLQRYMLHPSKQKFVWISTNLASLAEVETATGHAG